MGTQPPPWRSGAFPKRTELEKGSEHRAPFRFVAGGRNWNHRRKLPKVTAAGAARPSVLLPALSLKYQLLLYRQAITIQTNARNDNGGRVSIQHSRFQALEANRALSYTRKRLVNDNAWSTVLFWG